MSTRLELKKFDMSRITHDKICVFIGKRKTGKSFCVRDLLYNVRDIPCGIVMSATEKANSFYSSHVPNIFIHDEWNSSVVDNLLDKQRRALTSGRKKFDTFIILDDLMYDKRWIADKGVSEIFMNGRHYKILFILTLQYALGIPPALRANVDFVFVFKENVISNRKRVWEHYCGVIPTFKQFNEIMDACTEDFKCLVIDNSSTSNVIGDCVFWYKAESHTNFRVGTERFWKLHEELTDAKALSVANERAVAAARKDARAKTTPTAQPPPVDPMRRIQTGSIILQDH